LINDQEASPDSLYLYSRSLPVKLDDKEKRQEYLFFYIGENEPFLNSFQLYFNKNRFLNFIGNNRNELIEFKQTKNKLMRRFYLIEKAKDSKIFGILIGTMAIAKYKEAINHASGILKKARRKFYSFLIGKLNCAKLNNFMEVDMYVLIACNENSLLDSKEFNKPIITLYELEMAFNCSRLWGDEFIADYSLLLDGMKHHLPLELSKDESDVSLISGEIRYLSTDENLKDENRSLIKRDDALSVIHHYAAGEFLKNRSWTGLEQNLGQTPVVSVVDGRKGLAMGYENEDK
jgi:diphthamide biosynthesis protein 2